MKAVLVGAVKGGRLDGAHLIGAIVVKRCCSWRARVICCTFDFLLGTLCRSSAIGRMRMTTLSLGRLFYLTLLFFSLCCSVATQMTGRRMQSTFKKDWLSDPSTYPIMIVLGIACTLAGSFIAYKVSSCPDVRVTSKCKGHVVRTW